MTRPMLFVLLSCGFLLSKCFNTKKINKFTQGNGMLHVALTSGRESERDRERGRKSASQTKLYMSKTKT